MSTEPDGHDQNAEVVHLRPEPEAIADAIRADITSHAWTEPPGRRPVLPPWLRHKEQRRSATRWAAGHAGHVAAFHAVRTPL